MKDPLALYKEYHVERDDERLGLFVELAETYEIERALYPGSFVHISPSLVFSRVVYVDSDKRADDFFKSREVLGFLERQKRYPEHPQVTFHQADYRRDFGEQAESFDLLISQYAGFVSQACKKNLRIGGILVANNSHGDAGMAFIGRSYRLIAVYNRRRKRYVLSENDLDSYFVPKSGVRLTESDLEQTQRGVRYIRSASGYVFQRVA